MSVLLGLPHLSQASCCLNKQCPSLQNRPTHLQLQACRRYPFWKQELDEVLRCNLGLETHKEELDVLTQTLTVKEQCTVEKLQKAFSRLPAFLEALRPRLVKDLFTKIEEVADHLLQEATGWIADMTEVSDKDRSCLGAWRALSDAVHRSAALAGHFPSLTRLDKVTLLNAVSALKVDISDDVQFDKADEDCFIETMGQQEIQRVVFTESLRSHCQAAFAALLTRLSQYMDIDESKSPEVLQHEKDVVAALKQLHRLLCPDQSEKLRTFLLDSLDIPFQLSCALQDMRKSSVEKLVNLPASEFMGITVHLKSLMSRGCGVPESLPAGVTDAHGAFKACKLHWATVLEQGEEFIAGLRGLSQRLIETETEKERK